MFDLALGDDHLFKRAGQSVSTVISLTNKYALYNFLSTFSGTHYVTPRALTAEIGFSLLIEPVFGQLCPAASGLLTVSNYHFT